MNNSRWLCHRLRGRFPRSGAFHAVSGALLSHAWKSALFICRGNSALASVEPLSLTLGQDTSHAEYVLPIASPSGAARCDS